MKERNFENKYLRNFPLAFGQCVGWVALAVWKWFSWSTRLPKNCESHIDASHSRQPLVKGERLVRYEVNTVMDRGVVARAFGSVVWEMKWMEV